MKRTSLLLLVVCLPFVFCATAKAQYLNEPYVVANVGGPLWWSDATYNPARNEYCMTWQNGYIIRWRRLDSTGAVLGSEFALADGVTQGQHWSAICYNSVQQEYLIVYSGWMLDNSDQMRLIRVNATTGAQIGGTIFLDAIGTNSTTGGLDIAYSSTSNSYMAVYESYFDGNIYSRRLDAFGNPTGSRIQIDTPSQLYSRNPQVAWNSVNDEYLATYMGSPGNGFDYFAQRVRASDGALLGSNLALTTSTSVYNFGGLAYDSNANKYLVVYDGGASPPYGQFVSNNATLLGSAFAIGAGTSTGWGVAAAYDSSKHEFLVSWSANQSATNFSRRVTESGSFASNITDNTSTWGTVGIGNWPPRPVYNTVNDEYLIHWHNSYATILDRRYKSTITQTSVSINLGNTNIEDLMTSPIGGDGDTVGATGIGGRECRRNMDPTANDFYFYFAANDGWAFQGNKPDVWIYVDYYDDATTGSITLNYDATSSAYKDGGTVWLTGTNSWKTQKWHVTDAYFGNRENNGGDFRIYVGNVVRYLDTSTVNQNTPSTTPPGQASNPGPLNGATGVITAPTLTWTAGANTTTSNVFFGTSNPPPFATGTAGTSYVPGTLSVGTTYYWRIDEYRSGGGTTNGNVWSFSVGGTPPGPATNPNPANGATGVGITSTLSWTAGSGATSHDVRFGTANPPPFIQNQTATTYNPGTTSPSTTYYWRIDEKNASGTTTGAVWSYTTAAPPNAPTVTAPSNGGTVTTLTPTVTWTGDAHDQYQVRVSQQNDSNTSTNGYDSGTVTSTGSSQVSGTLRNYSFYYVFVKLHTAAGGWGNWSAGGYNFIVNTDSLNGTVYLGNALLSASGWNIYDGTCENCTGIATSIVSDGGSNVEQLIDSSTTNRSKLRFNPGNVSFDTGASVASRMRATSITGTPTYNLGISNGNVGGLFLRLYTNEVRLVDINGTNDGSYLLDATVYHKYQLTVKNATAGNNATATWKVYVDGTLRITFTGAGLDNGFDGFMAGHAGTGATGTWWFDNISGRQDGEFTPAQWDPVY